MDLPERLGKYLLVERLAVGGMAEIYRARTAGLGGFEKVLAIKRLHHRYCADGDFIKMLIDEAKIAVQLSHSNIGQIFDLDHLGEHYFICMEFIDGRDLHRVLRRLLDRGQRLPIDLACHVAKEVCTGLDFAHRKVAPDGTPLRIIHRDVSPQNILISWEGEVKVVDFGIAKAARRAYETESGIIKGKFYYMSPEQARGEDIDHRSDIFSLGVVLYEALTGRLLYSDDGDKDTLLAKVREARIAPPSQSRRDVPRRLDQIAMKALAREPEARYQSAAAFGDALARFLHHTSPETDRMTLSRFMRELFEEAQAGSQPRDEHGQPILSRVEYQAEPTSLIYSPPGGPGADEDGFDADPFFADDTHPLEDGVVMNAQHTGGGDGYDHHTDLNLIDEADIEIIEESGEADFTEPGSGEDVVTKVRPPTDDIIDDLGTLDGSYDPLEREPTRIYKPQAVLAASPDAERGPLRGEAPLDTGRPGAFSESSEPTVITSISGMGEPDAGTPGAPRPSSERHLDWRDTAPPRAHRPTARGFAGLRSSPAMMVALFLLVLGLGAAIAFGVQLAFSGGGSHATSVSRSTDIPQPPAPTPAVEFASYYVTTLPDRARVELDGQLMGSTPTTLENLQVGSTHHLRLSYDGYRDREETLQPTAAGSQSIAYTLDRLLGSATIETVPTGAAISLNGNFVHNSPVTIPGLDPQSNYMITASMPGYRTSHQRLDWSGLSNPEQPLTVNLLLEQVDPMAAGAAETELSTVAQVLPATPPGAAEAAPTPAAATHSTTPPATAPAATAPAPAAQTPPSAAPAQSAHTTTPSSSSAGQSAPSTSTTSQSESSHHTSTPRSPTSTHDADQSSASTSRDRTTSSRDRTSTHEEEPSGTSSSRDRTTSSRDRTSSSNRGNEPTEGGSSGRSTPQQESGSADSSNGHLNVETDSQAHVFVDGRVVATHTPFDYELAPGNHQVKVYFVELRRFSDEREVRIVSGETRSVHFPDPE